MGSEEETHVVQTDTYESSDYVILFDPLDGSSNIDVNVSVGTIFSIFKKKEMQKNLRNTAVKKERNKLLQVMLFTDHRLLWFIRLAMALWIYL